jgi:hypothetical protein
MRTLHHGEQVFAFGPIGQAPMPWIVDRAERGGYRCWRHDGHSGRIWEVFSSDELETLDERNRRGKEEDWLQEQEWDRIMGRTKRREPLYPV